VSGYWLRVRIGGAGRAAFMLICGLTAFAAPAARAVALRNSEGSSGVLLGTSQDLRSEFAIRDARRVASAFAGLQVGSARATVSPEELAMMFGSPQPPEAPGAGSPVANRPGSADLTTVEIDSRARRGIVESAPQASIPFGLAGIAWAIRHPSQAWRLVLPVMAGDSN
jgi:hypothetical protein